MLKKLTIFQTQRSVTHANPEWYVLIVFSASPCLFDLQTTVSCYNFKRDKDLHQRCSQNWPLRSWIDTRIAVYPSTFQLPTKKWFFKFFCGTIINIVFSFINNSTLQRSWSNGYGRSKWTRWSELKSQTRLFEFHIVLVLLGKVWVQLFFLRLWINSRAGWALQQPVKKKENFDFKPVKFAWIWPCVIIYLIGDIYIYIYREREGV